MAKRTNAQIRKDTIEEVRQKDALRSVKSGKNKPPGSAYRNPKVNLKHEPSCCLDKKRLLPQVFKQCVDCPKLTEAGSDSGGV